MRPAARLLFAIALGVAAAAAGIGQAPFEIRVEHRDPEVAAYAAPTKAVCDEWYPRINEILYGPDHPLPYREVRIVFEPLRIVGSTDHNLIRISSDWLKQPHVQDYRAVAIHELTHVAQAYPVLNARTDGIHALTAFFKIRLAMPNRGWDWLEEGIADYVTYTYFTRTNQPRLRLDANGYLTGYDESIPYLFEMQQAKLKPGPRGYRRGYTVASAFLLWLEERKDKAIVRRLNLAMSRNRCSKGLFERNCGAPLDRLWQEFLAQDRN